MHRLIPNDILRASRSKVKIPSGAQSGKQLRLKDKGMPQLRGSGFEEIICIKQGLRF